MIRQTSGCCTVCGRVVEHNNAAYLLTANLAATTMQIHHWDRKLARIRNSRAACGPDHVMEMAALWMATGSLGLFLAQTAFGQTLQPTQDALAARATATSAGHRRPSTEPAGELSVDRPNLQQVFQTNPDLLISMLAALLDALRGDEKKEPLRQLPTQTGRPASVT